MGGKSDMGQTGIDDPDKDRGGAIYGLSVVALAGAVLLIIVVLGLATLALYHALGFSSNMFFWTGILAFIVVIISYPLHMATESGTLLAVTALFGFAGVASIYLSIYYSAGDFDGKITPIILFTIVVIILLLVVWGSAKSAAKQKVRISLRKKT